MYSSDDSDDGEICPSDLYRSPVSGLKPALDSIFAEVQANIPVIGSDSDFEVSSDEEPVIFNRSGDLTSLSPTEDLSWAFTEVHKQFEKETVSQEVSVGSQDEGKVFSSTSTDSGLSLPSTSDFDRSCSNQVFKASSEDNTAAKQDWEGAVDVTPQLKTMAECSVQTEEEESELISSSNASSNHSHDSVALSFSQLADIDFEDLMRRVNEVTVSSWSDRSLLDFDGNNNDPDSDSDESGGCEDLMRQLINLSQKQQDETSTVAQAIIPSDTNNTTPLPELVDDIHQKSNSKDFGVQTNTCHNDTGTMAMQSTSSVGVSASFGPSSYKTGIDHLPRRSSLKSGERGTVFIDLRNQKIEPKKPEKGNSLYTSSIQRILGINESESSSSSSEDEEDMELWHEQRRRIKQGLAERNLTYGTNTANIRPTKHTRSTYGSDNTASNIRMKKTPTHLNKERTSIGGVEKYVGLEKKTAKDLEVKMSADLLEVKVSDHEKISEVDEKEVQPMPCDVESKFHDSDEYIMIKIDDTSPTKTVAEFVSVSSLEYEESINTVSSTSPLGLERGEEVALVADKEIPSTPLVKEDVESEITENETKEVWVKIKNEEESPQLGKFSLEEKITKLEEKHPVKEELVMTSSTGVSIDTLQQSTEERSEVKTKDEEVKEGGTKKKDVKPSKKDAEQKILDVKLKAKKVRIQHRLESIKRERETRTVGGRVCIAAPETPIVFDLDASYEPQPTSLPECFSSKNYLLLSVTLSTCGELSLAGNKGSWGKNNNRGTQTGSYCFNKLIAWLLSIVPVPVNTHYEDNADFCDSPFHVIGLQQTWHEGELSIKVGICSRDDVQRTCAKQGSKANNFQASVAKFLRTNTLYTVLTKLMGFPPAVVNTSFGQKNLSSLLTVNPDPQAMIRVFGAEPGFYWKTHEVEDTIDTSSSNISYCGPDIQNSMMLVQFLGFHDPSCSYDILNRIWKEGLDLAGIRLLYTQRIPFDERPGLDQSSSNVFPHDGPLLAIAIRGPNALSRWLDVVGPKDTWLARRTDPTSLRVVYGNEDKEDHMFYCPRNANRANMELARWFGGRVPPGDSLNIGNDDVVVQRPRSGSRGRKEEQLPTSALHTPLPSPPCTLVASTESLIVIIASPLILSRCLGIILAVCNSRGFTLNGIRRIRFHPQHQRDNNRDILGLTKSFASDQSMSQAFLFDGHNPYAHTPFSLACTMICLRKENGMHHVTSLLATLTEEIAHMEYLPREVISQGQAAASKMCFAVVPFSEQVGNILGNKMKQVHNSNIFTAASLSHSFYSNPELEQVCVFTLLKEKATRYCHDILDQLTLDSPRTFQLSSDDLDKVYCGFELLGIKFVSSMTMHQAKEFTPYEIGDKLWQSSLKPLTSGPALICAFRGVNAFERLRHFIHCYYGCSPKKRPRQNKDGMCPDMFMSSTPEIAYRQLTAIFFEHELHADHSMRSNQHLLPRTRRDLIGNGINNTAATPKHKGKKAGRSNSPARGSTNGQVTLSPDDVPIISSLLAGPCLLTTICVIKPDAVPRHIGKVLKRLTREGFAVVNMRMDYLTQGDAWGLVLGDWDCLKDDRKTHIKHLTSGPVVILSIQRENAIGKLLDILGPSNPDECRQESQFFLRGSYGLDRIRNALYGSRSYENAVEDHKLLFTQGVCCSPTIDLKAEGIPCLASDKIFNADTQRSLVDVPEDSNTPCSTDNEFSTIYLPPSLLEVNCILLLPNLLKIQGGASSVRSSPGFTEVIEGLINVGLQLVGLRMLRLNDSQAAHCTRMYCDSIPPDIKPHQMACQLSHGPCIVIAVVRDGAVTSFDTLLGNPLKSNSLATRFGKYILAAKSFKKARRLVECFFDHLMPNKKSQIECNSP